MEEALTQLGLNEKEARIYLAMINGGEMSAHEIAKACSETRTNTYMILEQLTSEGLVVADESRPVKQFVASEPMALRNKLQKQQQELKQKNAVLSSLLPDLNAAFRLGQHRPGVLYLEGIDGFKLLLDDNAKSSSQIDLIASEDIIHNQEAWSLLHKGIAKRFAKGIKTRGLFNTPDEEWKAVKMLQKNGYDVRRWGKKTLPGEIVIYDNKVAFTTYHPALIVTILTNDVIANTFRVIFDQLWQQAEG